MPETPTWLGGALFAASAFLTFYLGLLNYRNASKTTKNDIATSERNQARAEREERIEGLTGRVSDLKEQVDRLTTRLDRAEARADAAEKRAATAEQRAAEAEKREADLLTVVVPATSRVALLVHKIDGGQDVGSGDVHSDVRELIHTYAPGEEDEKPKTTDSPYYGKH